MSRDDCYFYFYSHCAKGSSCPFRHEEAALGKETVCNLWKEGRCFKTACPNRHMAIQKDRSQIPCYWQKQPGGCQKPHCVFSHNSSNREVVTPSDPTKEDNSIIPVPDPLDWGVLKAQMAAKQQKLGQDLGMVETPSPKVKQIVINPFEEESDQESMNGSPVKVREQQQFEEIKLENMPKLISLKKKMEVDSTIPSQSSTSAVDSMSDNQEITSSISPEKSLGIKTLEEIQRERAILSMQKRRLELAEAEIKSKMAKTEEPKVAELISSGRRVIIKAESENFNESPVKIQQQRLEEVKSDSTSKLCSPKKTVDVATREKDVRCDDSETETFKEDVRSKIKKRLGRIELREDDLSESSDGGSSNTTRVHVKDRLGFKSSVAATLDPETRNEEVKILVKKKSATPEKPLRKTITLEKIKQQITKNEDNKTKTSASPAKKLRKTVTLEKNTDATEEKRTKSLVQTVSIKSLADIKSKPVTRRKSEDKRRSRKARDSIQLYRPPAAIECPTTTVERQPVTIERKDIQKTSSSVDEKKRKLDVIKSRLSAKEEKIAPPKKISEKILLSSEQRKTNDWVAVKSFAEIMREKQERKAGINLKRESNKDNMASSEENSSQNRLALSAESGKPLASNDGLTRKSRIVPIVFSSNDGSLDRQKKFAPSKKFENGSNNVREKKSDPNAFSSSDDSSNASNPQCNRIKIKRSISPISFDAKVGSNKSAKDVPFKRKKFSKQSDVQSRNETSRTSVETDAAKTDEQIDCWNAVSGDADDSCNLTLSLNDEPLTDTDNIAKRLTDRRTSLSEVDRKPSSGVDTKREKVVGNEEGATTYDDATSHTYDDEDDLFTKQLDDFMVDMDAIPNEQNESNPSNDDQLLLEMEELLS